MADVFRWFRRGMPRFSITLPGLLLFGMFLFSALVAAIADILLITYTSIPPEHFVRGVVTLCVRGLPIISALIGMPLMVAWAGLRVFTFHPLANRKYLTWLRTSPWQPGKPLPLGPLGVSTQDCLAIVVVSLALYFFSGVAIYVVPMLFLAAYGLAAYVLLASGGNRGYAYAVAFGLGVPLALLVWPWAAFAALVALYGVAHRGLERSLDRFPWEPDKSTLVLGGGRRGPEIKWDSAAKTSLPPTPQSPELAHLMVDLGWPLRTLRYRWQWPEFSRMDAVLLAVLPGFYIGMLTIMWRTFFPEDSGSEPGTTVFLVVLFCPYAVLVRLTYYVPGCAPPISILGRLLTGRIFIPRYDVVFAAPIAALVAGFGLMAWMLNHGFGDGLTCAGAVTAVLLILFNVGPSVCKWRLTGGYRSAPRFFTKSQNFVKL